MAWYVLFAPSTTKGKAYQIRTTVVWTESAITGKPVKRFVRATGCQSFRKYVTIARGSKTAGTVCLIHETTRRRRPKRGGKRRSRSRDWQSRHDRREIEIHARRRVGHLAQLLDSVNK